MKKLNCLATLRRRHKFLRNTIYWFGYQLLVLWLSAMLVLPGGAVSLSADITVTGRTQTAVVTDGASTNIHTNTISGQNAYNSFGKFNVQGGHTANLYLPDGTKNLVNLVHNERSQIDGILNSYKNGQIGGNVFFLNPHGVVIGSGGVVNVGSLNLQTPTSQYLNELISENGTISAVHERQLFDGNVPLSPSGLITVKGKINAVEEVQLKAGNVNIAQGAQVRAGRQVQIEFGNLVNVDGVKWGNDLVVTPEGKIKIVAANNVEVAGEVKADAVADNKAGNIEIESGKDINVQKGAVISAKGNGSNSDGGEIIVYAGNNSTLEKDAIVDVSAGESGVGGFLEFSATKNVNITGNGLRTSLGGTILIDPENITWNNDDPDSDFSRSDFDQFTDGGNFILSASDSITLTNIFISTRKVVDAGLSGDDKRNAHLTGDSTENSGNITLTAPKIKLQNTKLLAHATGTHTAGDVKFLLDDKGILASNFDVAARAEVEFSIDSSTLISGKNVLVQATAITGVVINFSEAGDMTKEEAAKIEQYFAALLGKIFPTLTDIVAPGNDNHATTTINIHGTITASDSVSIKALSEAHAELLSFLTLPVLTVAGAGVVADSKIIIGGNAVITANGIGTNSGVVIESQSNPVLAVTASEQKILNSVAVDIAAALGISHSSNTITINKSAHITAAKDISVEALTTRSHKVSASGGAGNSYLGVSVGVLYGDNKTNLNVHGVLNAVGNITLDAKTTTTTNSVGATVRMAQPVIGDWGDIVTLDPNALGFIGNNFGILFQKFGPSTGGSNFDAISLSGAIAFMKDSVETKAVVQADLTAGNDITIGAETTNKINAAASTVISSYVVGGDTVKSKDSIALSLPLISMKNDTSAVVSGNANLKANGLIKVAANTEIPYNTSHPLYKIIDDPSNAANYFNLITALLSPNLGIDNGFLNTWSQSVAKTDDWSIGAMVTMIFAENTTKAVIDDGVTISGQTVGSVPKLNVSASTEVKLINLVGNFMSLYKGVGGATETTFRTGELKVSLSTFFSDHMNMFGNESDGTAIGGTFVGSFIDNTTIAQINHATINASTVEVKANTKSADIGISIGGDKSAKGMAIEGMFGLTKYDSFTLAKIDDSAVVTANSVAINAVDDALRVGIAGGFVSGTSGISVSGIITVTDRQAHAVWGNLLDSDGNPVTIKGEISPE
ncbi:MAG: leukotoxin LktA family filamentous adhesin, partial [Planctomycetaceae bacterium]|nr:leukotoxin LktA family filamentous adhesin [Planctomycetaceae bacterium]